MLLLCASVRLWCVWVYVCVDLSLCRCSMWDGAKEKKTTKTKTLFIHVDTFKPLDPAGICLIDFPRWRHAIRVSRRFLKVCIVLSDSHSRSFSTYFSFHRARNIAALTASKPNSFNFYFHSHFVLLLLLHSVSLLCASGFCVLYVFYLYVLPNFSNQKKGIPSKRDHGLRTGSLFTALFTYSKHCGRKF